MRPARTGIENSQGNGQETHSVFPKCTGGLSPFARAAHPLLLVEHLKRLWDALLIGRGNHWFPTERTRRLRVGAAHGGREEVGRQGGEWTHHPAWEGKGHREVSLLAE